MSEAAARAIVDASAWTAEMTALREILLGRGLEETVRWGQPCYALDGANVVLIHGFKTYCALLFFKGALMADPQGLLVRQTQNAQSARQIRFTRREEIEALRETLEAYVAEAVRVERSGLKVEKTNADAMAWPEAFAERVASAPELGGAFAALTPGRRRAYLLYFAAPKQAKTRAERVEKHFARILAGKGLDD